MNRIYLDTARLLIQVAPLVFVEDRLALKGGTYMAVPRHLRRFCGDMDTRDTAIRAALGSEQ